MLPKKESILIVEDNRDHMKLASTILYYSNYIIHKAWDGQQAVEKAKRIKPDIILMDIEMPIMDGIAAIREIKSEESTRNIPIIVLTVHDDIENKLTSEQLGCDGFLSKPFTPYTAEVVFNKALRKRSYI